MSGCYAVFHKQLGDLVLLQPALEKLADLHGGDVHLLTRNGHEPLVELLPRVTMQRGLAFTPRKALYCYDPLNKSAFRSLPIPVLKRICILPEQRETAWYHRFLFSEIIVPELRDRYVAEYFWSLTPPAGSATFPRPRLNRPLASWKPTWHDGTPHILVNPTAGWKRKSWQADHWATCLDALSKVCPERFILTSGQDEWQTAHCAKILRKSQTKERLLIAPTTSLKEFLWLSANASAVLTVDGAAAHLASAFSVPSLAVFGPTHLPNWHLEDALTKAIQAPISEDGIRHLKYLGPQPVLDIALPLLTRRAS